MAPTVRRAVPADLDAMAALAAARTWAEHPRHDGSGGRAVGATGAGRGGDRG
jgi:hypothetical protein